MQTPTPEVISRAEAKAQGLLRYFTGKPCPAGHIVARRTRNGECEECGRRAARERMRAKMECPEFRERNRKECMERGMAYRADPEYDKAKYRKYSDKLTATGRLAAVRERLNAQRRKREAESEATRMAARERRRQWAKNHPHKAVAISHRRRARKLNATPPWFGELDELAMLEAADLAKRREAVTGFAWHIDHAIPLAAREACGLHCAANLQVIPASVNIGKKNRMRMTEPLEWLRAI